MPNTGAGPQLRRRTGTRGCLAAAMLLATFCSCAPRPAPAPRARLQVAAAVSLQPALEEARRAYGAVTPDVDVRIYGGASRIILHQLLSGAPAELFLSASTTELDELVASGRVDPASRRRVASNVLVLVVARGREAPADVGQLREPAFGRIAVGNPRTAPLGRYTEQALRSLDLWEDLRPRFILGEHARQVAEYVRRGEAGAGIVYRSDAKLHEGGIRVGPAIPASAHPPILYEGAVLLDAQRPDLAASFLEFLDSQPGRHILQRHGLLPPPRG